MIVLSVIVRYRFLTTYSRLPPDEHREEPAINMFIENNDTSDRKSGLSYVEDFFAAIKIFGYLDQPVFQELTKELRTYKLLKGEYLTLDQSEGFFMVVDGAVQILVRSSDSGPACPGSLPNLRSRIDSGTRVINGYRYQILNEVHRGAPISSLLNVLSLFSSIVNSSSQCQEPVIPSDISVESLDKKPDSIDNSPAFEEQQQLLALAVKDATISVIPRVSFHRITHKFPKSTVQIIQIIMARLSRVTFKTTHYYLGLTPEIYELEVSLNKKNNNVLPQYLGNKVISDIKELVSEDETLLNNDFVTLRYIKTGLSVNSSIDARSQEISVQSHKSSHPGDLFSNLSLFKRDTHLKNVNSQASNMGISHSRDEKTHTSALYTLLTELFFKALGLDANSPEQSSSVAKSHAASPMLVAADEFGNVRNVRRFSFNNFHNNIFNINKYQSSIKDDESIFSSSTNVNAQTFENAQAEISQSLEIRFYKKGSILIDQNGDSVGVFYLINGILENGYYDKFGVYFELYTIESGGIGGFIGAALSYRSFVQVRAKTDVYVGFIPRKSLERVCERYPFSFLGMIKKLTGVLPELISVLDLALEWVQVPSGQVLFKENDEADSIYLVLNGRLRSVQQKNGQTIKHGEYGQGDSIGELEVLTVTKRPYTLHAVRSSELAKFPRSLFESLAKYNSSITIEISRIIASRLRNRLGAPSLSGYEASDVSSNFKTVSIVPISNGLPVTEFGLKLFNAYKDIGQKVISINSSGALQLLGKNAFHKIGILKLASYLADLEEQYQTVLYVADSNVNSLWTETCISQADCILLLANASNETDIGEFERLLVTKKTSARTEFVLLHEDRYVVPGSTAKWLKNRIWVNSHHHIQLPIKPRVSSTSSTALTSMGRFQKLRSKVQNIAKRRRGVPIYSSSNPQKSDFNRLARILSGQAIGLVLGGGGARGISHIGVIKALEENGIPIDFIGGTSIGSFVGGLYARDYDIVPIYGRAKKFAQRVSSLWRMAFDLTLPATAYTTGHEFNRGVWKAFGDSQIEDFWLRYYANSTNITHSCMEVHKAGYAWRYIRASMSLAGLLPPITDKGSMLLDGGYMDNLPVSVMKAQGAKFIFAVDVGSVDDTTSMDYGDTLSGVWALLNRINIFSKHPNVPSLAEIQLRLTYVSSVGTLEKAKTTPGVIYLRPPVEGYATLDFGKFDEIYRIGVQYGHEFMEILKSKDKLPDIAGMKKADASKSRGSNERAGLIRRNSI